MYRIDIKNKKIIPLNETNFSSKNLKERYDIQEWIEKNPEILEEDILIIQKEYVLPSWKRLDLLAIDRNAKIVILELKRDDSGDEVEWQAIKYASYCSRFSRDDIVDIYANYAKITNEESLSKIEEFVDDFQALNREQRIILISKQFHSDVASAAFWLREKYNLDIKCVKLIPFVDMTGEIFLEADVIIPLKEMADYIDGSAKRNSINRWDDNESDKSRYAIRMRFWENLLKRLNSQSRLFSNVNPRKDHWLITGAWVGGISYTFVITKKYVSVELWINTGDIFKNKKAFDFLLQYKAAIDIAFWSSPPLDWDRMDDKVMSRIDVKSPWVNYFDEDDWDSMIEFQVENIIKLEKAFSPYIQKLKNA